MAGYYCTNNEKQDYQFIPPVTVWDENGPAASFKNRPLSKPYFAVFDFMVTHESRLFPGTEPLSVDPAKVEVPPYYPDNITVRKDIARLFTNIEILYRRVGELIRLLKEENLYDSTIIFFYSDHGGALPRMKRELLERGTHIPLIIRFPGGNNGDSINNDLISAVDFAPTVLSLAGIKIPPSMQGQAFLGKQSPKAKRKYVFAARDRMDSEYDRVRMVKDKRYRYLYNYMPDKPYYQDIAYRLAIPMMKEILMMKEEKKLNLTQATWFSKKPVEELYDVVEDPHELKNLASDPNHQIKLAELRSVLKAWTKLYGDMGAIPEAEMIQHWWNHKKEPPSTAMPSVVKTKMGVKIACSTKGASIGYRIVKEGLEEKPVRHSVTSWDWSTGTQQVSNGQIVVAPLVWQVYAGETIKLKKGDVLYINAMRIGYQPAIGKYANGTFIASH